MLKKEWIYRELLYQAYEQKNRQVTQSELSKKFAISLSTVSNAIEPLRRMNAVEVKLRSLVILDPKKILYHWASVRNLNADIIYKTRAEMPVREIENLMPNNIVFAAYSAFKFKDTPADYSEVYVYADADLKERFPESKNTPNLFVFEKDNFISDYGKTTTIANTYVDIWNLHAWYAKEFLNALDKKV